MIKAWIVLIIVFSMISLVYSHRFYSESWKSHSINEVWEITNSTFKIRVTAYKEEDGESFILGAYYVFQASEIKSNIWQEVMVFRHDDPVKIPHEQIRFLSSKVGYVFMGWMYAVTVDSGITWFVWNAQKDLPSWECCNYKLIGDVQLKFNGRGTMVLNPIPHREGEESLELYTKDYGKHWEKSLN